VQGKYRAHERFGRGAFRVGDALIESGPPLPPDGGGAAAVLRYAAVTICERDLDM